MCPDPLVDPGSASAAPHDPRRAVPIQTASGTVAEDRSVAAFTDDEVNGSRGAWGERDRHGLACFAMDQQGAVTAFEAELVDTVRLLL